MERHIDTNQGQRDPRLDSYQGVPRQVFIPFNANPVQAPVGRGTSFLGNTTPKYLDLYKAVEGAITNGFISVGGGAADGVITNIVPGAAGSALFSATGTAPGFNGNVSLDNVLGITNLNSIPNPVTGGNTLQALVWNDNSDTYEWNNTDVFYTYANTVFVDGNGDNATTNGYVQSMPYAGVQTASQATMEGDSVQVYGGTYVVGDATDIPINGADYLVHSFSGTTDDLGFNFEPGVELQFNNAAYAPFWADKGTFDGNQAASAKTIKVHGAPDLIGTGAGAVGHVFVNHPDAVVDVEFGNIAGTQLAGNGRNQPFFGFCRFLDFQFQEATSLFRFTFNINDNEGTGAVLGDDYYHRFLGERCTGNTAGGLLVLFNYTWGQRQGAPAQANNWTRITDIREVDITHATNQATIWPAATTVNNFELVRYNGVYRSDKTIINAVAGPIGSNLPYNAPAAGRGAEVFQMQGRLTDSQITIEAGYLETTGVAITTGNFSAGGFGTPEMVWDNTTAYFRDMEILATGGAPAVSLINYVIAANPAPTLDNNSRFIIENCRITTTGGNSCVHGGDLVLSNGSEIIFRNCILETTTAGQAVVDTENDMTFENCIFINDGVTNAINSNGTPTNIKFIGNNYSNGGGLDAAITSLVGTLDTTYVV